MLSILLIGVGLSMDAFAVSVANGLAQEKVCFKNALWMGVYFGGFQFLMPLIGYFLGTTISDYVSAFGPYICFFLLFFIGGKMIVETLKGNAQEACPATLSHRRLLVQAVATSLDALAVGISFAFMDTPLLLSCVLIGCTTFIISFAGACIGAMIPGVSCKNAGFFGGIVLIAIGVKILLEGIL